MYDSFGRPSDKLIGLGNTVDADYDVEQKEIEQNCGQRCLAWLMCIHHYGIDKALLI